MVLIATPKTHQPTDRGITIRGPITDEYASILTPEVLNFLAMLQRRFGRQRQALLQARQRIQQKLDSGWLPDFPTESQAIRQNDWKIAPIPPDLQDRRVEITGSVDRKMIVNALNCGANAFMADFEDATSPTWDNLISGQINLRDAIEGTIEVFDPKKNKVYQLNEKTAVLIVRPRGWHLPEDHILIDGQPISGSLFDFGLYFFHNAKKLLDKGTGPYFYLPKLENHHEAQLWNEVFIAAEIALGVPAGCIKATVLIETILAAFEMDEILYALRDRIVALNCGRWDYIFSFIKKFCRHANYVLSDRAQLTMTRHFMRSYSLLTIQTCHRRGAMAMGGMAAQIPIKDDPQANDAALFKVRADKEREAQDGHDGTWVAHPALVPIAREVFDHYMPKANQVSVLREDVQVTAQDLLKVPDGSITEAGLRHNIRVGIQYLNAWLDGAGCVPLYHLMEDAATAEICRAQIWQWLHHQAKLEDGRTVDILLLQSLLTEEVAALRPVRDTPALCIAEDAMLEGASNISASVGATSPGMPEVPSGIPGDSSSDEVSSQLTNSFDTAVKLFVELVTADEFAEFLTWSAYRHLVEFSP